MKHYLSCLILFVVGCLAKSQMIPFLGVIVLLDYLYKRPLLFKKSIVQKIPFLAVAILFGIITLHFRNAAVEGNTISLFHKFSLSANQITWYIVKLFLPIENSISYKWPEVFSKLDHLYSISVLPLLFATFCFRKKNRLFTFGILFFLKTYPFFNNVNIPLNEKSVDLKWAQYIFQKVHSNDHCHP